MHNEAREKLAGVKAEAASLREALGAVSPGTPGTRLERLRAFDVQYERERAYMEQILHPVKAAAAAAEDARRLLTVKPADPGGQHRFEGGGRVFASGAATPPGNSRDCRDRVAASARGGGNQIGNTQAEMAGPETARSISRVPAVHSASPRAHGLEPPASSSDVLGVDSDVATVQSRAVVLPFANASDGAHRIDAAGVVNNTFCHNPRQSTPPALSRGEVCPAANSRATPVGYLTPRIGERSLSQRDCLVLDEKIGGQFKRVEDQMEMQSRQSEKLQDVLYKKVADTEVNQSRLERRVFELVGTVNGLSDETQRQVRRVEAMDARLSEFRHDLEEQFRQRFGELQTEVRSISSRCSARVASAEQQQLRQQRQFEELEAERHERGAELTGAVLELRERMEAIAEQAQESEAITVARAQNESPSLAVGSEGLEERCWHMEKQVTEVGWKLDQALSDLHDKTSRLADHEERLKGMRTKLDSQDRYATFDERIRHDWEARIDRVQRTAQEAVDGQGEHRDQLNLMRQRTEEIFERHERHESAITGLYDQYESLALEVAGAGAPPNALTMVREEDDTVGGADMCKPSAYGVAEQAACLSGPPGLTAQLAQLHREVGGTAARVAELEGEMLSGVAGTQADVASNQAELASVTGRLSELEGRLRAVATQLVPVGELQARLGDLEDRVPRADVFDAKIAALTEHAQALSEVQREVAQQLEALNGGRS